MGKKILIVDDEKDVLAMLGMVLSDAGYEVIKTDNGDDAIEIAKNDLPALILLDILLPDMDGSVVAETLESNPATRDIPVIFLTGLLTRKEAEESSVRGGKYFVAKPFNPKELLEMIGKYVEG